MSKAVTTKETTQVPATQTQSMTHGFDPRTIVLPALSIRQNTYKQDYMKKYKPGDIILMPADKALASEGKPVVIVPLTIDYVYRIMDITEKVARSVGWEPHPGPDLPQTFETGGRKFRRDKAFVAHALLREGLDKQLKIDAALAKGEFVDPSDIQLPVRIIFSRGGLQAGKLLHTHFFMIKQMQERFPNVRASGKMFSIHTAERENDDGKWFVLELSELDTKLRQTPTELAGFARTWEDRLSNGTALSIKADDDGTGDGGTVDTSAPATDERF